MLTFSVISDEQLDGLMAETIGSEADYSPCGEMTFEAPNLQVAQAFIEAWNAIEASTWSDSLTFLGWEPQVVDAPSEEYHLSWQEIQADRSLCREMAFYPQSTAVA